MPTKVPIYIFYIKADLLQKSKSALIVVIILGLNSNIDQVLH